jgi:hypothetical protein
MLDSINDIVGEGIKAIPQIVMVMVETNNGSKQLFTMLHDNAHTNISSLFAEERNRDFANDSLTFVRGVIGSYPAAYFSLKEDEINNFVSSLKTMSSEKDYIKLLDNYAVRRTSPDFWSFSDKVHSFYQRTQPIEFGLLDYNRFENR